MAKGKAPAADKVAEKAPAPPAEGEETKVKAEKKAKAPKAPKAKKEKKEKASGHCMHAGGRQQWRVAAAWVRGMHACM